MNRNAKGRPQGGVEKQSEGCSPWWPVREGTGAREVETWGTGAASWVDAPGFRPLLDSDRQSLALLCALQPWSGDCHDKETEVQRANLRLRPGGGMGGGKVSVQALKGRVRRSWSSNPPAVAFSLCPPQHSVLEAGAWGALSSGRGAAPLLPFHFPVQWLRPGPFLQVPGSCPRSPSLCAPRVLGQGDWEMPQLHPHHAGKQSPEKVRVRTGVSRRARRP